MVDHHASGSTREHIHSPPLRSGPSPPAPRITVIPPADAPVSFRDLALSEPVLRALTEVGYESPSPIQAATIPHLLAGRDVLGQAQTGTGKTAAFALPVLSQIDLSQKAPQALVLVPTRELAIQVAEAFQRYAAHLPGFHVLPIYGGQSYQPQLQSLRRGVHVIVATPGRMMDHMKRETLSLAALRHLVLDEADEMLRMGFIDDVEWILEQTPKSRRIALFSATLPPAVRRIAQRHLQTPAEVTIKSKTSTAANIRQRYWLVSGLHKLDALTRILEAERFDAMLVFTRTKQATVELAERLEARGFAAEALNGDIPQPQRERTITRLKAGQVDIVVATDVAARGLDVERVSHVVNYDIPYDSESYVHRIGRTGRAGRSGEAILFVSPRERHMLRIIERATRQPIDEMDLPTIADVNEQRLARFNDRITAVLGTGESARFLSVIERYEQEHNVPAVEIAAALAALAQGKTPLFLEGAPARAEARPSSTTERSQPERKKTERPAERAKDTPRKFEKDTPRKFERRRDEAPARDSSRPHSEEPRALLRAKPSGVTMETYRVEVGHVHGVKPGNIVGAIANEAGLEGQHIGRVEIREDHSFVDLPEGMPNEIFRELRKVRVAGQPLQISKARKTHQAKPQPERGKPPRKRATRH